MILSVSKAGFGPADWLKSHSNVWPLVLPVAATGKLLALSEDESWNNVAKELKAVTESSLLGKRLFGFAAAKVVEEAVQVATKSSSEQLLALESIGVAEFNKVKSAALQELEALPGIDLLPERRAVIIEYRGWPVQLKVSCLAEQLDWCLMSALRGAAAAAKAIPLLPAEEWLCSSSTGDKQPQISEELLVKSKAVRELMSALVGPEDEKTGESMQADNGTKREICLLIKTP